MSAKSSPRPLAPPNMTPGGSSTGARVVATRRSTWLASGALGPTTRVPYGRLEQPTTIAASPIAQKTPTLDRSAASFPSGARRQRDKRAPDPSPMARTLFSVVRRAGPRRRSAQCVFNRSRQEACFRRLDRLLILGHEQPDRQQNTT